MQIRGERQNRGVVCVRCDSSLLDPRATVHLPIHLHCDSFVWFSQLICQHLILNPRAAHHVLCSPRCLGTVVFTRADVSRGVKRLAASVCDCVCVCLHGKIKTVETKISHENWLGDSPSRYLAHQLILGQKVTGSQSAKRRSSDRREFAPLSSAQPLVSEVTPVATDSCNL